MDRNQPLRLLTPRQHDAVITAARRRAAQLRDEAQQAFFSTIAQALRHVWHTLRRNTTHARC